jgi:serine/threonine-protein kinase
VALEVLRALDYAHTKRDAHARPLNLVHRDISPSNVMVSHAGEVKLTDFGIAKRQADVSTIDALKGKLGYLSPEQSQRSQIDARSDLYSLGIVLYEMVVGERLFAAATARELLALHRAVQRPPSPRSARPDVPIGLDRVVQRALEPKAEKRFQSAGEFADALAGLQRAGLRAGPEELKALMRGLFPTAGQQPVARGAGTQLTLTSLAAVAGGQPKNGQREAPRPAAGTERLANPADPVSDTDPLRKPATSVAKHRQRSEPRRPDGRLLDNTPPAVGVRPMPRPAAAATSDSFFDEGPGMALVATDTEPMAGPGNAPITDMKGRAVVRPKGTAGPEPGRPGGASAREAPSSEDPTAPPAGARGRRNAPSLGDNDATLVIDRRKAAQGAAAALNAPARAGTADEETTARPARASNDRVRVNPIAADEISDAVRERHRETAAVPRRRTRSGGWRSAVVWVLGLMLAAACGYGGWFAYLRLVRRQ